MRLLIASLAVVLVLSLQGGSHVSADDSAEPAVNPAAAVDYVRDIKPIFLKHCAKCHGRDKQRAGFRLDMAAAMLAGGDSGPAIVPGNSQESLLIQVLSGVEDVTAMPYKAPPLPTAQIDLVKRWIDQGANLPAGETIKKKQPEHWAFRKPVRPDPPQVNKSDWVRNAIDRFILARLQAENIEPAPEADRVTLIRRLSLDLLGLPPTIPQVDRFLADNSPQAYQKLVDRLLASPHFGERWGRHWLDLARYADSNGFTLDSSRDIWKYRDWVIEATNRDLPFDQFTIQQIAGDMLPGATTAQKIATGFHRNTLINEEGGTDQEQFRIDAVADRVHTTGSVFMGLTLECARCHSHKFDPISQREYYRLFAFFNNCDEPALDLPTPEEMASGKVKQRDEIRARVKELKDQLVDYENDLPHKQAEWEKDLTDQERSKLSAEIQAILAIASDRRSSTQAEHLATDYKLRDSGRKQMLEEIKTLEKSEPKIVSTLILSQRETPRKTHIHKRGNFLAHGDEVAPGVPAVLHPLLTDNTTPDRLDLARWLVSPENPLTPRVVMNRFWQRYFGIGLVETENDFGTRGDRPSHPELLDWLATEFVARNWSMKAMHRLIVTSATYRQSSRFRRELAQRDPRNRLLARQSRTRLDAEIIRDAALAASGLLTSTIGGPSVFPPQPPGIYAFTQTKQPWNTETGSDRYRRGMYTFFRRSGPYPALMTFDFPESNVTCTRRNRSNTPLQALTLSNDETFFEMAQALAQRVLKEASPDDGQRVRHAFQICLSRRPSTLESRRLVRLIQQQRAAFKADPKAAGALVHTKKRSNDRTLELATWTAFSRVLLNLDEFITRE